MIANLVGFCVGVDGMKDMLSQIFGTANGKLLLFDNGNVYSSTLPFRRSCVLGLGGVYLICRRTSDV
jgi:hypothetical protein